MKKHRERENSAVQTADPFCQNTWISSYSNKTARMEKKKKRLDASNGYTVSEFM